VDEVLAADTSSCVDIMEEIIHLPRVLTACFCLTCVRRDGAMSITPTDILTV